MSLKSNLIAILQVKKVPLTILPYGILLLEVSQSVDNLKWVVVTEHYIVLRYNSIQSDQ